MKTLANVFMVSVVSVVSVVFGAAHAHAQTPPLKTPEASPAATVTQVVGITEMKVSYHRPAVNGRKVWGGLVPFGEVWRAGANENTTITFSSAVKVGGKPLKAGTYGVHMIPTAKDWTLIFSNMSVAWGSFTYDQKEDALRVTVTPQAVEPAEERLSYSFDDPTETQVTLALRWEKLRVPVKIEVDTPQVVMERMREDLRGIANFSWQGWAQAGGYWAAHGGNLDEALRMVDKSIGMNKNFQNTMTRAAILEKKGNAAAASELRTKAVASANEAELNQYGYLLMQQKKLDEAQAVFQKNVKAHPESWNVHDSLAELYAAKGDKAAAIAAYEKALSLTNDPVQKKRITGIVAGLKGK